MPAKTGIQDLAATLDSGQGPKSVIPAEAGIQNPVWTPAFAGVTEEEPGVTFPGEPALDIFNPEPWGPVPGFRLSPE